MTPSATPDYLTALEIADLRLAGLPTTKQGINRRATADQWPWRERAGRGGGREFCWLDLPDAARADYIARRGDTAAPFRRRAGRPSDTHFFARHPDMAIAVQAILATKQETARNVMKLLATQFAVLPSLRGLQRFMAKVEADRALELMAIRDPDKFKSRNRMALGRMDATVAYAHQMWEIDTTKADVMCTDGRWAILGIIDRWSRRARFQVVHSESAQSVRRILVDTITAWGCMPATLKVDNGSGFMNATIKSALDILGIALDPCLPGHPEDKPHIERVFGTCNRERLSMLPGFIGHNVAQAQKLRAAAKKQTGRAEIVAKITGAELQGILDGWVDGEYHLRKHDGIRMSPMQRWQSSPVPARAAPDADVLKIALSAHVGVATVGKRGVQWKRGRYWAETLAPLLGRQVSLRRDEDDLGALFIFDEHGQFIDVAVNAERSGMSEQQFALAARRHVDKHVSARKDELKAAQRSFSIDKARDALLREEAEQAGKLHHLPMPTRAVSNDAMDSIANAPMPVMPAQARLDEVMAATAPIARPAERTPAQKVADADAIINAANAGKPVDPDMLRRAHLYASTSEYRAEKMVLAHFNAPPKSTPRREVGAA